MQGFIALVACLAAFVMPVVLIGLAILGLADYAQATETLKTWLAYIGPFAGTVIGHYFKGKV